MANKARQHIFEIERPRLTIDKSDHVDTEARLQLCLTKQVVNNHLRGLTTSQIHHNSHTFFVGLIAQLSNTIDLLIFHKLSYLLNDTSLIYLIRNLSKNDRFLILTLNVKFRTHDYPTTASGVGFMNTLKTIDQGARGEVRCWDKFHKISD